MNSQVDTPDWSKIPAPTDDGAARHLTGMRIPSVPLPATDGTTVDLSVLTGLVVVYAYPRTGRPGVENRMVGTSSQGPGDARRNPARFAITSAS